MLLTDAHRVCNSVPAALVLYLPDWDCWAQEAPCEPTGLALQYPNFALVHRYGTWPPTTQYLRIRSRFLLFSVKVFQLLYFRDSKLDLSLYYSADITMASEIEELSPVTTGKVGTHSLIINHIQLMHSNLGMSTADFHRPSNYIPSNQQDGNYHKTDPRTEQTRRLARIQLDRGLIRWQG